MIRRVNPTSKLKKKRKWKDLDTKDLDSSSSALKFKSDRRSSSKPYFSISSSSTRSHQPALALGFVNTKNTCYANAVLQVLFHIPTFTAQLFAFHQYYFKENSQSSLFSSSSTPSSLLFPPTPVLTKVTDVSLSGRRRSSRSSSKKDKKVIIDMEVEKEKGSSSSNSSSTNTSPTLRARLESKTGLSNATSTISEYYLYPYHAKLFSTHFASLSELHSLASSSSSSQPDWAILTSLSAIFFNLAVTTREIDTVSRMVPSNSSSSVIDINSFLIHFWVKYPFFTPGDQHDAQEFLRSLLLTFTELDNSINQNSSDIIDLRTVDDSDGNEKEEVQQEERASIRRSKRRSSQSSRNSNRTSKRSRNIDIDMTDAIEIGSPISSPKTRLNGNNNNDGNGNGNNGNSTDNAPANHSDSSIPSSRSFNGSVYAHSSSFALPTRPLDIESVFKGQLCHVIKCLECETKFQRHEPFLDLSLPVEFKAKSSAGSQSVNDHSAHATTSSSRTKRRGRSSSRSRFGYESSSSMDADETGNPDSSSDDELDEGGGFLSGAESVTSSSTPGSSRRSSHKYSDNRKTSYLPSSCCYCSSINWSGRQSAIKFGSTSSPPSLVDSLNHYTSPETLRGSEKYFCSTCSSFNEAQRYVLFSKLPTVLTVHLNRFTVNPFTGTQSKITTPFTIPFCIYHLQEFVTDDFHDTKTNDPLKTHNVSTNTPRKGYSTKTKSAIHYELFAFIVHKGDSILRGHYFTFVKKDLNPELIASVNAVATSMGMSPVDYSWLEPGNAWICFDDSKVTLHSEAELVARYRFTPSAQTDSVFCAATNTASATSTSSGGSSAVKPTARRSKRTAAQHVAAANAAYVAAGGTGPCVPIHHAANHGGISTLDLIASPRSRKKVKTVDTSTTQMIQPLNSRSCHSHSNSNSSKLGPGGTNPYRSLYENETTGMSISGGDKKDNEHRTTNTAATTTAATTTTTTTTTTTSANPLNNNSFSARALSPSSFRATSPSYHNNPHNLTSTSEYASLYHTRSTPYILFYRKIEPIE